MADRQARKPRQSRDRVPVGVRGGRLSHDKANEDPSKVYRWVNDEPGRIARFERGGYAKVTDDGSPVTEHAGGGQTAYLMAIDRDLYDEDQQTKLEPVREVEKAIKAGRLDQNPDDGRYVPRGGIEIEESKGRRLSQE